MPVMGSPTKKGVAEEQPETNQAPAVTMSASETEFLGFESANTSLLDAKKSRMRRHFEEKLKRIEQALRDATLTDESFFKGCATRLACLMTEYETWHVKSLDASSADEFEREESEYASFEKRHFEISLEIERSMASSVVPTKEVGPRAKLPEIRLQTFDGKLEDWLPFRDAFVSLIDDNKKLSDVDKLRYLKGSLQKDALNVIADIEITATNYTVAWQILKSRFENKKLVVKRYLDGLFSIPQMKRESYDALISLIDNFERGVKMTTRMGVATEGWSELLAHMLCAKLDVATLKQWETHHQSTEVAKYEDVLKFLRHHVNVLQATQHEKSRIAESSSSAGKAKNRNNDVYSVLKPSTKRCPFCSSTVHSAYQCDVFRKATVDKRQELVRQGKLCFNCLSAGHQRKDCSSGSCRLCKKDHHTLLHRPGSSSPSTGYNTDPTDDATSRVNVGSPSSVVQHCEKREQFNKLILLPTAVVKIVTSNGTHQWPRALLDGGSQINIVTERLVQRLGVPKFRVNHSLGGIGMTQHTSRYECHVLRDVVWDQPSSAVDYDSCQIPDKLLLADPHFYHPGPVDILIGREGCNELLLEGMIRLDNSTLLLQNTELGWVVSGGVSRNEPASSSSLVCNTISLGDQLSRFWELEACSSPSIWSREERECEEEFERTTERDGEGRFVVALPKHRERIAQLGDSYERAKRRFVSLTRRLDAQPDLKLAYGTFIKEYLDLKHMEEIDCEQSEVTKTYYMPHHCVIRPESLTTKLRVVFDASAATDTGISLNDVLMVGPSEQDDLISLLLRFRVRRFAMLADIEKMYRQIWVKESDHPLQRILWKEPTDDRIRIYQLKTVTYGTACAPYLATRCLQALAKEGESSYPRASKVLHHDFYMDDMITGVESVEEGQLVCREIIQLLNSAGFHLRKWASNSAELLANVPTEMKNESDVLNIQPGACIKALGLKWIPSSDQLGVGVPCWKSVETITKRMVLSDAAKLFDPLGLIGPVIVVAKCFMQELWKNEKAWDEPLEVERQQFWLQFRDQLAELTSLTIPRWAVGSSFRLEAHGFSDASQKAYGACIYLRTESADGQVEVRLLCAKSKVAPIPNTKRKKNVSIPRLELSGALLLSHLWQKVKHGLRINLNIHFWVDSTIVLHWISSNPSRWKQFVANRVAEIQHQTHKHKWSYVASEENPADIISRGMMPALLKDAQLWWNGPAWLRLPKGDWQLNNPTTDFCSEELEERSLVASTQEVTTNSLFSLTSSFNKLVRVTAWIQRFLFNCDPNHRSGRRKGFLQAEELASATLTLVRLAQGESFAKEIRDIGRSGTVNQDSKLKTLSPLLDNGVLRVGGRLRNASLSFQRKHPIILAPAHPLTLLIVRSLHLQYLHAGQQLLTSIIRERFWSLRIRNLVRKVVHECVSCFRAKPTTAEQLMGDLPTERVSPTLPFNITGVDLCGPFLYKQNNRKAVPIKCYVAIFICMVTKAVHIEMIEDLSTAAFVSTLKRFIARRGKPYMIECDNAKNFRGAERALKELQELFEVQQHREAVSSYCASEGIVFKFIPPRSPNFGGLWESAVKLLKRHLRATIGTATLRRDDLETILAQAEACLNSRPLTAMSSDPEDLEILTPGHFLINRALTSIPEPSYEDVPSNRLDR